ncbi:unnamed protein product [Owenia fusiformis]|uniref:Uncharacterized protein n=1 Tax=Owenia fusiformis TaxID=6347 RepID=A0A8J1UDS1_OWEFU|nr:unnamed protein product [Owenia fusiformis]
MQYFTCTLALLTLFAVGSLAEDVELLKRLLTELEIELEERNEPNKYERKAIENCVNAIKDWDDKGLKSLCAEYVGKGYCETTEAVPKNCATSCKQCAHAKPAENCLNAIEGGGDKWHNLRCEIFVNSASCKTGVVRTNCAASCACGTVRPAEPCMDMSSDCDFATKDDCENNAIVKRGCKKTCNLC